MEASKPRVGFGVTGTQPEDQFEVRTLEDGSVLTLSDGRIARVVDNPHDGVWLVCEFLDAESQPIGDVETVLCYDIASLLLRGPTNG